MNDEQVLTLEERNLRAAAALGETLYRDPSTRHSFQELIKKKFPTAEMPDYDARMAVAPDIDKMRAEHEALKKTLEDERRQRAWNDTLSTLKADPQLRITDEEVPHVVDLMKTEHIGSPKAAAELLRRRQQLGNPTSIVIDPSMRMPGHKGAGGDEYKGLWEDRRGWARARIGQIMSDFANGNGSKWA